MRKSHPVELSRQRLAEQPVLHHVIRVKPIDRRTHRERRGGLAIGRKVEDEPCEDRAVLVAVTPRPRTAGS